VKPSYLTDEELLMMARGEMSPAMAGLKHTVRRLKAEIAEQQQERKAQRVRERKAKRPTRRVIRVVK
jgi:hypothetical protein